MPYDDDEDRGETPDEKLLREIRETYKYYCDRWKPAREERKTDIRYICGDPWDPSDRQAREDPGSRRPTISHDEMGQYVIAAVNQLRTAKRGIRIEPGGEGADDKSAELRQNIVRGIEYKSQAQGTYMTCFQNLLEGSYAFFRVGRKYVSDDPDGPDDQEITIGNIPNPDSVLYDPDCKTADWSDARRVFVLDPMREEDFKDQFPDAKKIDFSEEDRRIAKDWIQDKIVLVAEYWRVEITKVVKGKRIIEKRKVMQYITNGIEILERNEQPGTHIPIIPMFGLERWQDAGHGPERLIFSLVRLARDPQMSLAYLCSLEMEEAGLTPKSAYIGYVGQFETDKEHWDAATKIPIAYLQVDPIPDSANGTVLPLPQRIQFTPNFPAYEMAKDSARRAIQAAMGISPLPTAMQRDNAKSGVALERIQQQQAIGSYHFVDKFEAALAYAGRIIDSWIPVVYDAEDRQVAVRLPNDTHQVIRLNTKEPYQNEKGEQVHYPIGEGKHDVTVSAGPSDLSQRDEADKFLDNLLANLGNLPVAPPQAAKILSLGIKMKQLGPIGDEIAEIISPEQQNQQAQIPPQIQQAMQQAQVHLQAVNAYAQQLEQKVKELEQREQAKVIDNEYRVRIEQMKIEADLAKAEINTKAQVLNERVAFIEDLWKQLHQQNADASMQAADQAHERDMAMRQGMLDSQQSDQQAQQEQDLQAQSHAQNLELQNQAAQTQPQEPAQ